MQFSTVIFIQNKECDELRREIRDKFNTKQAWQQWDLHITVGSGVNLNESQLERVKGELKEVACRFQPFEVKLKGFGFFDNFQGEVDNPYLAYIDVEMNEKLRTLHQEIEKVLKGYPRWYPIKEYVPHLTLAYDDLTKESFERLKKYLEPKKEIAFTFVVESFSLAIHRGRYEKRERYVDFFLGEDLISNGRK